MNSSKRSKVIKSGDVVMVGKGMAKAAEFKKMECTAPNEETASLEKHISEAEKHRLQMEETIEKKRKETYKAGFEEGFKKGEEKKRREALSMVQALSDLIKEISFLKKSILDGAEQQMLELAFAVAEKVVHQEITINRDVIQSILRDAIRNIVDKEGLKIRLNPEDYRYMLEIKSDFFETIDGVKNVVFEEAEGIKRGGVVIESLFGEVDARIDKQFTEIKNRLSGKKVGG